jgi:hypothetical protein
VALEAEGTEMVLSAGEPHSLSTNNLRGPRTRQAAAASAASLIPTDQTPSSGQLPVHGVIWAMSSC